MRILLVEASHPPPRLPYTTLSQHRFVVDRASNSEEAWELLSSFLYDLLLLEAFTPCCDGIHLCRRLRNVGNPVLILLILPALTGGDGGSAQASHRIQGFTSGADACLTQPVDGQELLAHIQALARRGARKASPVLSWGPVCLHPTACQVTCDGRVLTINRKEYQLLELLLSHPRQTFSRAAISDRLWPLDETLPTDATIKTHIRNVRRKLEQAGVQDFIQTHYGHGYRLNPSYHARAALASDQTLQPGAVVDTVTAHVWQELMTANARLQEEIEHRQRIAEQLERSERMLRNAQQVAQIGSWEFDMQTQTTYWTEELYRIHGLDPSQPAPTPSENLALIHPDDHPIHTEAILKPVIKEEPFEANLRIIRNDGEIRYVNIRGGPIFDDERRLIKIAGTTFDITQWVVNDTFSTLRAVSAPVA
ncbi:winged helix-turn-helix domain-containing protein [Nodosilinea sp. PGN35]|uniref:response regulator transcription factor n=1 Tax=Nodosilinea sp. PGN35 TaxID=3020489 RepID=UPI0023B225AA|nr:winged helix-turn-helix domain-containing protein [Nodosilinea sp. TSF1-S3]MDF0369771.1 winged helix-turn-helix domain-containing protein [Nodosilinea sp. TSF1-S3]